MKRDEREYNVNMTAQNGIETDWIGVEMEKNGMRMQFQQNLIERISSVSMTALEPNNLLNDGTKSERDREEKNWTFCPVLPRFAQWVKTAQNVISVMGVLI